MDLKNFRDTYVTNLHREIIFSEFTAYLETTRKYLSQYNLLVYGSFVTFKEKPNDIDVLLHGYVKDKKYSDFNITLLQSTGLVHVKLEVSAFKQNFKLMENNELVEWFQNSEKNKVKQIIVGNYKSIDF